MEAVKATKEIELDNEPPWDFNNYPDGSGYRICEEWMNDGYMFSIGDFS